MTQEGINDLTWFLGKLGNISKELPELQKLVDLDTAIAEKKRLKDESEKQLDAAKVKLKAVEDKTKELEADTDRKHKEAQVLIVQNIKDSEARAQSIVSAAKKQEDIIQARIKKAQDTLSAITKG